MNHIYDKINEQKKYFSKGFNKIANYFIRDPQVFALNSATQAGNLIGVSETTIIRFANELGYSGYSALQHDVQQSFFNKSNLSGYLDSKTLDSSSQSPIKNLMFNDIENIKQFINQIPESELETVVNKLSEAKQILTCGVRSSYGFASWFAFTLDLIRGNTRLYQPNNDDILLRISELDKSSVVVAFSFHRYAVDTINLAKLAKRQGAYVVAFTDSSFSPITKYADSVLPIQLQIKSTLDAAPIAFTLMNSIISSVSLKSPVHFQERINSFDSIKTDDLFATDFLEVNKNDV